MLYTPFSKKYNNSIFKVLLLEFNPLRQSLQPNLFQCLVFCTERIRAAVFQEGLARVCATLGPAVCGPVEVTLPPIGVANR